MLKVLENIFSVKDYNETHHKLCIMGIKIKFPKREYAKKRKQNPYYYYKKNNIDITTIPAATGQIRDIQLANLTLLKELDYICKENNLTYWLDYGTLLGAIRHKGFIPWDDDIDTAMMREDYEKIIDAFKKSSRNPDIFADYVTDKKNNCIIKVQHKKCPYLFVDIFPRDYVNDVLTNDERKKLTNRLLKQRKTLSKNKNLTEVSKITDEVKKITKLNFEDKYVENSDIAYGLEYFYTEPVWVQNYSTYFPVKTMEFEGVKLPCPNKTEEYLTEITGNYMGYPNKIGFGHSMSLNIPDGEMKIIKELGE